MALLRMDNVLIVVEDLEAAIAFFIELGMELEGRMELEGDWVDRTIGIDGARDEIATLRTPDGHARIELTQFQTPAAVGPSPRDLPVNALGYRRIMFAVDDLDDTLARLRTHGAELVRDVVEYEDVYRMCFVRGPEGIILGIAQPLKEAQPDLYASVGSQMLTPKQTKNLDIYGNPPLEWQRVIDALDKTGAARVSTASRRAGRARRRSAPGRSDRRLPPRSPRSRANPRRG